MEQKLEEFRNKRVFLFQHVRATNTSGNAFGIYSYNIRNSIEAHRLEALLEHYTNVLWSPGHIHLPFYLQYRSEEHMSDIQ